MIKNAWRKKGGKLNKVWVEGWKLGCNLREKSPWKVPVWWYQLLWQGGFVEMCVGLWYDVIRWLLSHVLQAFRVDLERDKEIGRMNKSRAAFVEKLLFFCWKDTWLIFTSLRALHRPDIYFFIFFIFIFAFKVHSQNVFQVHLKQACAYKVHSRLIVWNKYSWTCHAVQMHYKPGCI